jgi:hypothetical protein
VSRSYEPLRATSCAIRLACSQARGATQYVATAVLAHALPCHARSAQPSGGQRRSARRIGSASARPYTRIYGTTTGSIHVPRTAMAAPKSTSGSGAPSVVVRQFCGTKASTQARFRGRRVSTSLEHHRKQTKGEERIGRSCGAHCGAAM